MREKCVGECASAFLFHLLVLHCILLAIRQHVNKVLLKNASPCHSFGAGNVTFKGSCTGVAEGTIHGQIS